jgi:hypothetical protein
MPPELAPILDSPRAAAIAEMVLGCIHREFPSHLSHLVRSEADVRLPRSLTPAFYGSFDWHSSVHGHWCLIRLARLCPDAPWRRRALEAVRASLTPQRLEGELAYLMEEGRAGFERPYGLAWLLQLAAELREWSAAAEDDDGAAAARSCRDSLAPLEALAAERIVAHTRALSRPVRGGEHSQTAFALGLMLDWARVADRQDLRAVVCDRAEAFYGGDRAAPIAYEPSGHDFLSPALGEADLMRRVRQDHGYLDWMAGFLPDPNAPDARAWLTPVVSPDRSDGKLSHLDGLNLSRAWMLEGIVAALPGEHPWRGPLGAAARAHAAAGMTAVPCEHYAGAHWLGSYAVYLLTRRGCGGGAEA